MTNQFLIKAHLDEVVETIPNCTFQVLKGVGHSCNIERPKKNCRDHEQLFFINRMISFRCAISLVQKMRTVLSIS
jgi:pimeloyl-ACP methyl ester carboxylesterase